MRIESFRVVNYKSFANSGEIHLEPGLNVIVGRNNVGKTALAEAMSLRFPSKPHRSLNTVPTPGTVWKIVGNVLAGHCYPELYRLKDIFDIGWGFKSLLGAMYLQMMSLMMATGESPRCKGPDCNKFITIEQLEQHVDAGPSKKYRTRKDKEFCSNRCKNRWHYYYGGGKYSKNARRRRQS